MLGESPRAEQQQGQKGLNEQEDSQGQNHRKIHGDSKVI